MKSRFPISSAPRFEPHLRHYHRPGKRNSTDWQKWVDERVVDGRKKSGTLRVILATCAVLLVLGGVVARFLHLGMMGFK